MPTIDTEEIVRLTEQYGGQWGLNHTRRLLHLVSLIDGGIEYDHDAVWLAAHLHDWGAYAPWAKPGVDHALRSTEVAQEFLTGKGHDPEFTALVVECIANHHSGDPNRRIESILLSDADGLDFLGVIGVMRDISKNPRDMRKGYESALKRRQKVPALLCLDSSHQLAVERLRTMDELLANLKSEAFDCF